MFLQIGFHSTSPSPARRFPDGPGTTISAADFTLTPLLIAGRI